MDNNMTPAQIDALCTSLEKKFALARCWFEPFPGRVYIRYATGFAEYLSVPEAAKILG